MKQQRIKVMSDRLEKATNLFDVTDLKFLATQGALKILSR